MTVTQRVLLVEEDLASRKGGGRSFFSMQLGAIHVGLVLWFRSAGYIRGYIWS